MVFGNGLIIRASPSDLTDDNSWIATVFLYLGRQTGNEEYTRRGPLTAEALLRTQSKNGLRTEQLIRNVCMMS